MTMGYLTVSVSCYCYLLLLPSCLLRAFAIALRVFFSCGGIVVKTSPLSHEVITFFCYTSCSIFNIIIFLADRLPDQPELKG